MEGPKNDKKIRRVVRLTLHNTGLHITFPSTSEDRHGFDLYYYETPFVRLCALV
jgi:hypothetical protein